MAALEQMRGGLLGEGHSWVSQDDSAALSPQQLPPQVADGNQEEAPAADIAAIQQQIIAIVKGYVDDDVDMEKPLAMQGLDSLAFMELRQKLEAAFGSELPLLVEDPQSATIQRLSQDLHRSSLGTSLQHGHAVIPQPSNDAAATSVWVGRSPFSIKLRLFCLPYAGGVSENVFARWANLLPASIQVCPIEIPGRGRRSGEESINSVAHFADMLVNGLPLQDKPYAIFGTCLGAIIGYEVAQRAIAKQLPGPVAFFPAAVSPPHIYAQAVMKLYLAPGATVDESSFENVIQQLKGWRELPRELVMMVFEKGNFAGIEEMKKNERLFNRIAPIGVNDILMAVQYRHVERPCLDVPTVSFEGLLDYTIDPNNVAQWTQYTTGSHSNVTIMGDHYFVSTHYKQVARIVTEKLLDIIEMQRGGLLGEGHSWV